MRAVVQRVCRANRLMSNGKVVRGVVIDAAIYDVNAR
jgi:hypothetical protein